MTARRSLHRFLPALLGLAAVLSAGPAVAQQRTAPPAKKYTLGPQHGPYMVMVAAIHPLRGGNTTGLSPAEAADRVVADLREQGIPAYTHAMKSETQTLEAVGFDGKPKNKMMATMRGGVCVLACNFKSAEDPRAQRALTLIKEKVKCPTLEPVAAKGGFTRTAGGGFFRRTPGHTRSPLSRAFLTVNPLLSEDQVRRLRKVDDPLLTSLNGGAEFGLHKCPGSYSVVVKEFRGRTLTQIGGTKSEDVGERVKLSDDLSDAAREAWELCQILRTRENQEAYVWHDRHRSVVTIGSFPSASDPAAVRTARRWAAKPHATTGRPTPEVVTVPKGETDIRAAKRYWMLEIAPYAMAVPNM